MAQLIVKSAGQATPPVIELQPGVNRFGRAPANDHFFDDPAISEQHCEISVGDDFVLVRDLGSTNGTFIDHQRVQESVLYSGQTLQIGPIEMVLAAPAPRVAIPSLLAAANPFLTPVEFLADGFAACLNHTARHAVWECKHCGKPFCDECTHRVGRVGGARLRLCPSCGNQCQLTPWSESVKGRKKSLLASLADKVKTSFKRTTQMFARVAPPARQKKRTRKG